MSQLKAGNAMRLLLLRSFIYRHGQTPVLLTCAGETRRTRDVARKSKGGEKDGVGVG